MKRFAKIILVGLAALAAVVLLALVGINLYLQSGDVQQRIRLATEQALGTPVAVKRTLYTPWGGLTLSGLSLPDPSLPGTNLVEASKFSVQFQFRPLLSRRLVISAINLASPHLVLRQTEDKKWVLLGPKPVPPKVAATTPSVESPSPAAVETPPGLRVPKYKVELRDFHIWDGSADIVDWKGRPLARVNGLSVNGSLDERQEVNGDLWIENIDIAGQLFPNRLRAHFVQQGDRLVISDAKCALAGGKVRAEIQALTPRHGQPAFEMKAQMEDISIPQLIAEAHGDEAGASGTIAGDLKLKGNPLDSDSLAGGGAFVLDAAQIRPLEFIQQIGMVLNIDELQMLHLQDARVRFDIRDEKVWITDLTLRTDNLMITGTGPIRFDGKLNLRGRFMVNEKIQHQLGGLLGDQFTPSSMGGYREVAFSVTGRTDKPKTDLVEKITGIQLRGVGGILKGLFRMPALPPPESTPQPSAAN